MIFPYIYSIRKKKEKSMSSLSPVCSERNGSRTNFACATRLLLLISVSVTFRTVYPAIWRRIPMH